MTATVVEVEQVQQGGLPASNGKHLIEIFAEFLKIDVANGDARKDTVRAYKTHVDQFMSWCGQQGYDPARVTEIHIKQYRQHLIKCDLAHATISLKLTTLRRFYKALVDRDILSSNPAEEVKAPREREAKEENIKHLTPGEVELLVNELNQQEGVKGLRDKAMVALMLLEGLRVVEIHRANVEDINFNKQKMLVRGKGKDGYIYPREDTLKFIQDYLEARSPVPGEKEGTPLFTTLSNFDSGSRISRRSINRAINGLMKDAGIKKDGRACHALRHTCGAMLYRQTKDIKVVQDTLRHSDPSTAARYSHIVKREKARYTEEIPINL